MKRTKNLWRIFRWPLLLGMLSLAGLLSALLNDGLWDALSWLMLAAPISVALRKSYSRQGRSELVNQRR